MEYIIGLLVLVVGYLFHNNQKTKAAAKLAEAKAKDQVLQEQEKEIQDQIETLDKGIAAMKAKQEAEARKRAEDNLSLKERADRIKKGLQ